jgi:hypothetical protein
MSNVKYICCLQHLCPVRNKEPSCCIDLCEIPIMIKLGSKWMNPARSRPVSVLACIARIYTSRCTCYAWRLDWLLLVCGELHAALMSTALHVSAPAVLLMCWPRPPATHRAVVGLAGPQLRLNLPWCLQWRRVHSNRGSCGLFLNPVV